MQFEEMTPWMVLPPVNYHLGVDGLSALMILLDGVSDAAFRAGFLEKHHRIGRRSSSSSCWLWKPE